MPIDDRPLDPSARTAVDRAVTEAAQFVGEPLNELDPEVFTSLAEIDDPRAGWIMVDLGQFVFRGEAVEGLILAADRLAGDEFDLRTWWKGPR